MVWYSYRPRPTVAERRRKAQAAARRLAKKGRVLAPVVPAAKGLASTFWGKAWCNNLDAYSDFSNRLPRGRTYLRNGAIIDLQISTGQVEALVQGTELYRVVITFKRLAAKRWQVFKKHAAGEVINLLDLLQGRLSPPILAAITTRDSGLFPAAKDIGLACSCPDWATMCKHVAAVLYGIGVRLDSEPELFFILRGVDMQELMKAATATAVKAPKRRASTVNKGLDDDTLSEIFGVEIETTVPVSSASRSKKKVVAKPAPATVKRKAAVKKKPLAKAKVRQRRPSA